MCLSGGCSQPQGLGDSWTHGSRRRRPRDTWITLMGGLQRPGEPRGGFYFNSFLKKELLADRGGQEPDSPSPTAHFLKASSTISPGPGLESHRRQSTAVHESFQGGGEASFQGSRGPHSLGCGFYAGFFLGAPHATQTSGVGTHLTAGIKPAAFSRDLSQRQGAAHQSASLETPNKQRVCVKESGLCERRAACQFFYLVQ